MYEKKPKYRFVNVYDLERRSVVKEDGYRYVPWVALSEVPSAEVIETLRAERDILMSQIRGECRLCSNVKKCFSDSKTRADCALHNRRHWEWCGERMGWR